MCAGCVAVFHSVIALFTRVQLSVAAERKHKTAVSVAADGAADRRLALLAKQRLDDAVAARAGKPMTALVANVAGVSVQGAVVAFLTRIQTPVAAGAAAAVNAPLARCALLVAAAGNARAIFAESRRALIASRARHAIAVFTDGVRAAVGIGAASAATAIDALLARAALRIGRTQTARAVGAEPRCALVVGGAIRALAVQTQIARTLGIVGARGALTVHAESRRTLQIVRALLALSVDTQTRQALGIVLAESDGGRCALAAAPIAGHALNAGQTRNRLTCFADALAVRIAALSTLPARTCIDG